MDESKIGKRKYNKGHPVDNVWIFGLVKKERIKKFYYFK